MTDQKEQPRSVRGIAWNALDPTTPLEKIQECYTLLGWGLPEQVTIEGLIEDLHHRLPHRTVVSVGYRTLLSGKHGWFADIMFLREQVWVSDSPFKTAMTALACTLRGVVADEELRELLNPGGK